MEMIKLTCRDTEVVKYIRHENIISVEIEPGTNQVKVIYNTTNDKSEYTSMYTCQNYPYILKELGAN